MAKKLIQVVYQVNDAALLKAAGSLKANEDAARKADDQVKKYGKDAEAAGNQAGKSFIQLGNIWKGLIAIGVVTFFVNLAKKTFELGAKQEQLNIAFTTFLGSAEKAKKLLAELNKFALVTPFTPDQVNQAAKALLAFGTAGDKIIPTLKMLGDISAGTGKDLAELAVIYGQISSTGRLMGQDLLQLINAGFNPLQEISKTTGRSMKALKKDMEDGAISIEMVEGAFKRATSEGGLFFNLTEKQSKSVLGLLSTVEGNIDEILKNLFTASSGPVKDFVQMLVNLSGRFLELSENAEQFKQRIELASMEVYVNQFKELAKEVGDVNKASETRLKQLEDESNGLLTLAGSWDVVLSPEQQKKNEVRLAQIQLESKAIKEYVAELQAGNDAQWAKELAESQEKQAEAMKKVNAERLKALLLREAEASKPAEEGVIETAQRGLFGFTIDEAGAALADQLKLQEDADAQILAQKALGDIAEIAALEEKEARKKEIMTAAFNFGVDLLGQALFASLEANSKGEKEMTAAEKRQAEQEKKIAIKRMLITTLLNSVKALGTPPVPNFAAAGLAAAFGLGSVAIAQATPAFAEGGLITGPGSGTSDSIPIMASNREFMINAEATGNSRNLLEAINDHRIDDRVLRGMKVTAGGVTVNLDNKGVEKAIRDKQEPEYYEQGHFVNKIIKKGDTLKLHIRAKSFSK